MTDDSIYQQALAAFDISAKENIWVFAYGSLMWNPEFPYRTVVPAHLCGYHRNFCLYSRVHRGTDENPGLVLGLDRGGSCKGVLFEIEHHHIEESLPQLWSREMNPKDLYKAKKLPVLAHGDFQQKIEACTFVANRQHPDYCRDKCRDMASQRIKDAIGGRGPNIDYLRNTVTYLRDLEIHDPLLEDLLKRTE